MLKALNKSFLFDPSVPILVHVMARSQLFCSAISVLEIGTKENIDADHQSVSLVLPHALSITQRGLKFLEAVRQFLDGIVIKLYKR